MMKNIIFLILIAVFTSCSDNVENKETEQNNWEHKVTVTEVIQTSSYTYLLVNENNFDRWIAVAKMDAKVGDTYYYNGGLEMQNFKSKELDRTFPHLLLVQVISDGKEPMHRQQMQNPTQQKMQNPTKKRIPKQYKVVNLSDYKSLGTVKLGDLINNPSKYTGKRVTVEGKVVKFNPMIMGRNWIHIVDAAGNNDLTITTNADVQIGQNVVFDGVIDTNKDFGGGYKYVIILESAVLK